MNIQRKPSIRRLHVFNKVLLSVLAGVNDPECAPDAQPNAPDQVSRTPADPQTDAEELRQSEQSQISTDLSAEDERVRDSTPDAAHPNRVHPSSELCHPSESSEPVRGGDGSTGCSGGLETTETEAFREEDMNVVLPLTDSEVQQEAVPPHQEVDL